MLLLRSVTNTLVLSTSTGSYTLIFSMPSKQPHNIALGRCFYSRVTAVFIYIFLMLDFTW